MDRKPNYYGVHDGYATIRCRGRPRPHAISRTSSKDTQRKPAKSYEIPKTSLILHEYHQVPRWSDSNVQGTLIENYNTLRPGTTKRCNLSEDHELRALNTFASRSNQGGRNSLKDREDESARSLNATIDNDSIERRRTLLVNKPIKDIKDLRNHIYDTVPVELNYADDSNVSQSYCTLRNNFPEGAGWKNRVQKLENVNSVQPICTKSKRSVQLNNSSQIKCTKNPSETKISARVDRAQLANQNRKLNGTKDKQIYAIPNIYTKPNRNRKYIEDINRNIAEIDESYESLKSSPASKNATYGVINKIAKGDILDHKLYGFPRKRDMAPMPSIGTALIENIEERMEKVSNVESEDNLDNIARNDHNDLPKIHQSSLRSTMSVESIEESPEELKDKNTDFQEDRRKNNRKSINTEKRRAFSECDSQNRESPIDDDKRCRSIDPLEIDRPSEDTLSSLNGNGNYRRPNGLAGKKCLSNQQLSRRSCESNYLEKKCDTLPYRRSTVSLRHGYKSGGDVLDCPSQNYKSVFLQRSCISVDEGACNRNAFGEGFPEESISDSVFFPTHLMDATDVILEGQLKRAGSGIQAYTRSNYSGSMYGSLRAEKHEQSDVYPSHGFSTLPRQGLLKSEISNNNPRQFSRNVLFEPLYEHAVSDLVKVRNRKDAIPWWELATRKYRHRSCPSLQAHVVSAFEQSLSNMTQRLQQLTATAEKKDNELQELRDTIERLRKQSAEAGLSSAPTANSGRRHTLGDSDSGTTGCTGNSNNQQGPSMARQLSADSVTSLNSLSSACSASSHHKKKGWLRSSFSKAFSRSRKNRHGSVSDAEDCKESTAGELSAPNSPRLPTALKHETARTPGTRSNGQKSPEFENSLTSSKSSSALYKKEDEDVVELKKQLREKDLVLTDIRLEALSSAHQLESLKDTVIKMRNEMLNLKQNNERLQRLVTSKSLTSSQSSLPSDADRRFSMTEVASTVAALANGDNNTTADQLEDLNVPDHPVIPSTTANTGEPVMEQDTDGKRINIAIYLGGEKNFTYNLATGHSSDGTMCEPPHCVIANVSISNKTTWDTLDSTVRRCFKEYVSRVDPVTNLGLGIECLAAYHYGEVSRCITDSQHPALLPCGYLVGHVKTIYVVLSGYSWLAIDTLIPRSIVQRLISLLTEHRRVILCGPSGTGKSYLAAKLAHALVDTDNDTKDAAAVATFNVDHKSSKELRQYLAHIAERCDSNIPDELPKVIILENLQHAASLGELFSGLLGTRHLACPAIIGTMSQATCSTTNLQLHHNFRWVLCANHMEPVKGFLGRYLRRKLLEYELRETSGSRNAEMAAVVEWLPRVWQHLNKFLETHSSSDVTIGPRLFLSCPMDVAGSQVWFTDLWNYSVIPYLVEAVREGLTLYGRRVSGNGNGTNDSLWEDPTEFIISNYPWISTHAVHGGSEALLRLRPEDVGYDVVPSTHASGAGASSVKSLGSTHSDTEGDPLLNMLMRLQEAANYSSPHSNDSDSVTSFDSSHTRHSEDLSSSTSSSRGVESAL